MKKCLLLLVLFVSLGAFAQNDSLQRSSIFNATLKVGSFSGQSTPTRRIQGFAFNPYVSFGKKMKLNIGFLIINLDTIGQGIDTLGTQLDNFEIGLSFEEYIAKTNLYLGGGLNLLGGETGNPFVGNRVMLDIGYLFDSTIDLSVQGSRTFNRNPGISGSLLMFGVGVRF